MQARSAGGRGSSTPPPNPLHSQAQHPPHLTPPTEHSKLTEPDGPDPLPESHEVSTPSSAPETIEQAIDSLREQLRAMDLGPEEAFQYQAQRLQSLLSKAQSADDFDRLTQAIEPPTWSQCPSLLQEVLRQLPLLAPGVQAQDAASRELLEGAVLCCLQAAADSGQAEVLDAVWGQLIDHLKTLPMSAVQVLMPCLEAHADSRSAHHLDTARLAHQWRLTPLENKTVKRIARQWRLKPGTFEGYWPTFSSLQVHGRVYRNWALTCKAHHEKVSQDWMPDLRQLAGKVASLELTRQSRPVGHTWLAEIGMTPSMRELIDSVLDELEREPLAITMNHAARIRYSWGILDAQQRQRAVRGVALALQSLMNSSSDKAEATWNWLQRELPDDLWLEAAWLAQEPLITL